jgi:hypothetical protein
MTPRSASFTPNTLFAARYSLILLRGCLLSGGQNNTNFFVRDAMLFLPRIAA